MSNELTKTFGLFHSGYSQEVPDMIIRVDIEHADKAEQIIKDASAMYENTYGVDSSSIERQLYIEDALTEAGISFESIYDSVIRLDL